MIRDKLQAKLKKLPDLERILSRIYTYSQKSSVKAIYIDISVITRLDEFYNLLSLLKKLKEIISDVFDKDALRVLKSKRLKALVQFKKPQAPQKVNKRQKRKVVDEESKEDTTFEEEQHAIFPDYSSVIEDFENMIQWKSVGNKKVPEPVPGLDEEFDTANSQVEKIKERLEAYIEKVRKELKCRNISYTTNSKRFRYEIEVPEDMAKKIS